MNSLVKHGTERMEDRGSILNGTDLNVTLAMGGDAFDVNVDMNTYSNHSTILHYYRLRLSKMMMKLKILKKIIMIRRNSSRQ